MAGVTHIFSSLPTSQNTPNVKTLKTWKGIENRRLYNDRKIDTGYDNVRSKNKDTHTSFSSSTVKAEVHIATWSKHLANTP